MQSEDQSPSDEHRHDETMLSPEYRDTIDRIFGTDPESFIPETDQDHAALNLLDLLNTPVGSELERTTRIDLVQVLASRLDSATQQDDLTLSPEDQRALDQYVQGGHELSSVDQDLRSRAEKCAQISHAVTSTSISSARTSDDLVERTLMRIQTHIDQESQSMQIEGSTRSGFSIRWSDLISVAAMFLLAASVIMPIMSGLRSNAQQTICFDNMNSAANAFGLYAGSNRDMLPMATAGFGPTWMDVGSSPERSNSSNLFTLVRTQMAGLDDLACPSNRHAATGEADPEAWDWNTLEEISYSYRIMKPGGMRATMAPQPTAIVLLADRSPVILRVVRGVPVIPEENSPNHNGKGQHMLMLDGSSSWADSPIINDQDNIWLPRPVEHLIHNERTKRGIIKGSELPDGPTDAFVGP